MSTETQEHRDPYTWDPASQTCIPLRSTCKDCKWWQRDSRMADTGSCFHEALEVVSFDRFHEVPPKPSHLHVVVGPGPCSVSTGPDFGCIHFTAGPNRSAD